MFQEFLKIDVLVMGRNVYLIIIAKLFDANYILIEAFIVAYSCNRISKESSKTATILHKLKILNQNEEVQHLVSLRQTYKTL